MMRMVDKVEPVSMMMLVTLKKNGTALHRKKS